MTTLLTEARPRPVPAEPAWAWRSGPCSALGHDFEVLAEPADAAAHVAPVVAPFRSRSRPSAHGIEVVRYEIRRDRQVGLVRLFADDELLGSSRSVVDLLGGLTWHVNGSVIDRSCDQYVLMHAAAASTGGLTVVLAADMESGKTTTVAGLLRSGFDYVTDEAVAVDPTSGRITPFPKTLSLDRGSWALFPECKPPWVGFPRRQWFVSAKQLGSRPVRTPTAPPRIILFPAYRAGSVTEIVPVSNAQAVHELARMTFHFGRHPRRNLEAVSRLVRQATVARLRIGSLDAAVHLIEDLVSERILEDM